VGGEELGHEREEAVIAHLAPQRIEEQHTLGLFEAEAVGGIIGPQLQTTVGGAPRVERLGEIVGPKRAIIGD